MSENIKVVVVEPGKAAEIREIPATLESYQSIVGGYIECVYFSKDNVALVCNEEGKLIGLPPNRILTQRGRAYDTVAGTFFVVGLGEDDFISLTDEQAEKYAKLYETPDFLMVCDCGGIPTLGVAK